MPKVCTQPYATRQYTTVCYFSLHNSTLQVCTQEYATGLYEATLFTSYSFRFITLLYSRLHFSIILLSIRLKTFFNSNGKLFNHCKYSTVMPSYTLFSERDFIRPVIYCVCCQYPNTTHVRNETVP
jgi:hypothetical protein